MRTNEAFNLSQSVIVMYTRTVYKISEADLNTYDSEKHRLPCWNCIVRAVCFTEKKANKHDKYLRYTLIFDSPCLRQILAWNLFYLAKRNSQINLKNIDTLKTTKIFKEAVSLFNSKWVNKRLAAHIMFIIIFQKDPDFKDKGEDTAYYYLGWNYYKIYKEYDVAIELYSKGIELSPKNKKIYEHRGYCFLLKKNLKSAKADFEKAKKLGSETPYLDELIMDVSDRENGLRGKEKFDSYYFPN